MRITSSIKNFLFLLFALIIILAVIPIVYSLAVTSRVPSAYDRIITNVSRANRLAQIVRLDISTEIWDIVAGKSDFNDGSQYETLEEIRSRISEMMLAANGDNRRLLIVASRTELTLERYIDMLGAQIKGGASVAENEKTLEEIRGVCSLFYDIMQEFIVAEIEAAFYTNEQIKRASRNLTIVQTLIVLMIIIISLYLFFKMSKKIRAPIRDMEILSSRIAHGDLSARAEPPQVEELNKLADNLNIMAEKIKELIDENIREQQNLQKAEMKTLQAQIAPHFLYNTFDTIVWLAEADKKDKVIEITRAFSNFFRISLSKGREWISVRQELSHVRNYLMIQKIRYANILDYVIKDDEGIGDTPILKLVLQPLVENAIYHGIKNKRGRGTIKVSAEPLPDIKSIRFTVEDNGIGFTPERLEDVRKELGKKSDGEALKASYGLYNVNKRLRLYYDDSAFLSIESEYGKGTRVWFTVPVVPPHGEQHV